MVTSEKGHNKKENKVVRKSTAVGAADMLSGKGRVYLGSVA